MFLAHVIRLSTRSASTDTVQRWPGRRAARSVTRKWHGWGGPPQYAGIRKIGLSKAIDRVVAPLASATGHDLSPVIVRRITGSVFTAVAFTRTVLTTAPWTLFDDTVDDVERFDRNSAVSAVGRTGVCARTQWATWTMASPWRCAADVARPLERIAAVDRLVAIGNQSIPLALQQHPTITVRSWLLPGHVVSIRASTR
jgi:hypothetical protein